MIVIEHCQNIPYGTFPVPSGPLRLQQRVTSYSFGRFQDLTVLHLQRILRIPNPEMCTSGTGIQQLTPRCKNTYTDV